ncbi:hypothetical protein M3699_04745 [Peribacillus simplex]|uniref:hypothetical protein n=1 Tax=Peribacillus simplex TaxID=1478 RepID=UPI00203DFE29|nr:hypothetical protein [Peribacillus simplex]MCM3673202.1 hypothetical protein [Peribacillus simplex]
MTLFERILEEKTVIDPVIWVLKIQFIKVDEDHEQYIRAMTERHKHNPKIMRHLKQYFEHYR